MKVDDEIDIDVSPGVYDPAEDSLLLIGVLKIDSGDRILEIGCGTGIISLHCAKAGADVTAADIDPRAVECTRLNAERNNLSVKIIQSNLFENIRGLYDLIIFNPPYLPDDETKDGRWSGGKGGIGIAIEFLRQSVKHLSSNGRILTICSSLSDIDAFERECMGMRMDISRLAERRIFFENIYVYEIRKRNTPSEVTS